VKHALDAARAAALALWLCGCATSTAPPVVDVPITSPSSASSAASVFAADMPPPEPREFRAAWVATVANIDWPSKPGLRSDLQRAEAVALLDTARRIGLNALVLQVRPAADAIYPSTLEPWSETLSGEQGRAPTPAYDPLAFWVEQAHRRGLELHVWFNPYRARTAAAKSPLVAPHVGVRQAAWVKRYGEQLWIDPGQPGAAAHTLAVVADVVRRYDVDGVHIDDYFYPYPVEKNGADVPFPDDDSWLRYAMGGGGLKRDDWRRANVDALVLALHRSIKDSKPWVRFGISPFGIGRPERRPAGITGFSQYDKLYADVEKWLHNGWLDYLAPQLYWPIAREGQQMPLLLDQWLLENKAQRHLWPGLFTSQLGQRGWPARELIDQVALLRTRPGVGGHIHFSMVALQQDREGIATLLQAGPYAQPALVPATPWLEDRAPPAPALRAIGTRVSIEPGPGEPPRSWAVWRRQAGQWQLAVLPGSERSVERAGASALVVSAVGRSGHVSTRNMIRWP
jgi:uncharacterized lipoprotein YddW (UPF0748 family)